MANGLSDSESLQSGLPCLEESPHLRRDSKDNVPADDDESVQQSASGRWTDEEHRRFIEGLHLHGKCWNQVSAHVGTRKSD